MTDAVSPQPVAGEGELLRKALPFLRETGWLESKRRKASVSREGEPIPWITYAALDFLAARIGPTMTVFEFGSGNSTLWWAAHVRSVTAVEHSAAWAERVRADLPPNAEVLHVPLERGGEYCRAARTTGLAYDIVVVDGRDRVNSALESVASLTPAGVIVWDNSDRRRYRTGMDRLRRQGFRELPFSGLAPIGGGPSQTSIFYRPENCLGI